jgi:hypothetical protein
MNRIRIVGLALMAVFALSAVAASAASAVEGPFWKVQGSRLLAGETRLLLASAKENFILNASGGQKIECSSLSLPVASEMKIIGSTGANGGTSLEHIEFSNCIVTGNGTPCNTVGAKVLTTLLFNLLGYGTAARGGPVLVLFEPESGKAFTEITFSGTGCTVPLTTVNGTVIGLARVNGVNVQPGAGTETPHGEVNFAETTVAKTIWVEKEGALIETKAKLEAFGLGAKLKGTALIAVDVGGVEVPWGVFTA